MLLLATFLGGITATTSAQETTQAVTGPEDTEPASESEKAIADEVRQRIFRQINDYRQQQELSALSRDADLQTAASDFAQYMAETSRYGHNADGSTPARRAKSAGYDYCVVRENIAYRTNTGDVTVESLTDVFVQGWIDSPPHRKNIVADYVTETGVGVATQDGITYFAVQLFGRPRSKAYKVQVTNRSEQARTLAVESDGNRDEFQIGPRMRFQMTRCLPTELALAGEEQTKNDEQTENDEQGNVFTIRQAAEFTITETGLDRVDTGQ